ncbi:hypothetical protein [Streptomyces odontomachi]|uniref:hypothetical protein n=1 Tax=Streptomyces odontomachi TaxID=2944940 RepID=UPI00210E976D|nr:hypothetical protein [Streptomyces sp. ODS25]
MRRIATTAAVTGLLLALGTGASEAATPTLSSASPTLMNTASFPCTVPQGSSVNYSWTEGITSTTVYYNNHCSSGIYVTMHFNFSSECWLTPVGKGSSIWKPDFSRITEGC